MKELTLSETVAKVKSMYRPHIYDKPTKRGPTMYEFHVFDEIDNSWVYITSLTIDQLILLLPSGYYEFIKKGQQFTVEYSPSVTVSHNL